MIPRDPRLIEKTPVFNFDDPRVVEFVENAGCYGEPSLARAVELLHDAVRDTIDYSVFNVPLGANLNAADVVQEASGFCLHKSILFVAGCRKLGVPSVLCSDIVTNHVADAAMLKLVGGEEFLHWYAQIYLNGRWIKSVSHVDNLWSFL